MIIQRVDMTMERQHRPPTVLLIGGSHRTTAELCPALGSLYPVLVFPDCRASSRLIGRRRPNAVVVDAEGLSVDTDTVSVCRLLDQCMVHDIPVVWIGKGDGSQALRSKGLPARRTRDKCRAVFEFDRNVSPDRLCREVQGIIGTAPNGAHEVSGTIAGRATA